MEILKKNTCLSIVQDEICYNIDCPYKHLQPNELEIKIKDYCQIIEEKIITLNNNELIISLYDYYFNDKDNNLVFICLNEILERLAITRKLNLLKLDIFNHSSVDLKLFENFFNILNRFKILKHVSFHFDNEDGFNDEKFKIILKFLESKRELEFLGLVITRTDNINYKYLMEICENLPKLKKVIIYLIHCTIIDFDIFNDLNNLSNLEGFIFDCLNCNWINSENYIERICEKIKKISNLKEINFNLKDSKNQIDKYFYNDFKENNNDVNLSCYNYLLFNQKLFDFFKNCLYCKTLKKIEFSISESQILLEKAKKDIKCFPELIFLNKNLEKFKINGIKKNKILKIIDKWLLCRIYFKYILFILKGNKSIRKKYIIYLINDKIINKILNK